MSAGNTIDTLAPQHINQPEPAEVIAEQQAIAAASVPLAAPNKKLSIQEIRATEARLAEIRAEQAADAQKGVFNAAAFFDLQTRVQALESRITRFNVGAPHKI